MRRLDLHGFVAKVRKINALSKKNVFKDTIWGYGFLLPEIIIFSLFLIYPVLKGFSLSFVDYNLKGSTWVGLANFYEVFKNELFWISVRNTTVYTFFVVSGGLAIALVLSTLIFPLSQKSQTFFKAAFYLPGVISGVVIAMSWAWIFDPHSGLLNYILSFISLGPYQWLSHPQTALFSLILMSWMGGQGPSIVILLANMCTIPKTYYEAARIDGANAWQLFWHVTIPLLRPIILYLVVMNTITSYQVFESIYIMTGGGPMHSTTTLAYLIYSSAFNFFEFDKASTIATMLFIIVVILSIFNFRVFRDNKDK